MLRVSEKLAYEHIQAAALQTTSNSSDSDAARDGGGKRPVLARLAEVRESPLEPGGPRAAVAGSTTYRFDPPQRKTTAPAEVQPSVAAIDEQRSVAKSAADGGRDLLARRIGASILPASDPFSLPRPGVAQKLMPVGQFLTLFVLFTIVGTLFLRSRGQVTPAERVEPAATAAQHVLEPQSLDAPADVDLPMIAPTAAGPVGAAVPRTGLRSKEDQQSPDSGSRSDATCEQNVIADADSLPQVQMSDVPVGQDSLPGRPIAVARLSGHVEAPTRQAQHDDHRSSIH